MPGIGESFYVSDGMLEMAKQNEKVGEGCEYRASPFADNNWNEWTR